MGPLISLISCSVSFIVLLASVLATQTLDNFSWRVGLWKVSHQLIVVGMISLRKVTLNFTIFSHCARVGVRGYFDFFIKLI
jgi:hypothetical protein